MISAARVYARSRVRRGLIGALVMGIVAGVAGGAVLAAVAGARRTDSAYPRLLDEFGAPDVQVATTGVEPIDVHEVANLPEVEQAGILYGFTVTELTDLGNPDLEDTTAAFASADGVLFYELGRLRVLDGRLPDADEVEEIAVNDVLADRLDVSVGDSIERVVVDSKTLIDLITAGREDEAAQRLDELVTPLELRVVGITKNEADIIPIAEPTDESVMTLTPAFAERFGDQRFTDSVSVRLKDPDDLESFEQDVRDRFPRADIAFPEKQGKLETVARSVRPYSGALLAFVFVAAVAATLVLGQILARQVALDAEGLPTLRSLGMPRWARAAALCGRAVVTAMVAAVVAAVVAVAASSTFPRGPARIAEPHPGVHVDLAVLGLGFPAVIVLVMLRAAVASWLIARPGRARPRRPSRLVERVADAGAPAPVVAGVRLAAQGAGGPVGPAATVFTLVVAVVVIVGALGFGASLSHVTSTPHLYGWNWDVMLEPFTPDRAETVSRRLARDDDLADVTAGTRTAVTIGDGDLLAFGFEDDRDALGPTIVEGRRPEADDEIALGKRSLDDLDVAIGDHVTVEGATREREMEVVAEVVVPVLSLGETLGLNEGAVLTAGALDDLEADLPPAFVVADLAPGVDIDDVRGRYELDAGVSEASPPSEVLSYDRVSNTPFLLAVLLAALGAGVLAHALVTAVRRRRRDLAVLKTIGFVRRQVTAAVAVQALVLATLAVVVGLPIGLGAGRWAWGFFAEQLGVLYEPVVSWRALAAAPLVAFGLANLLAFPPGWTAARAVPGAVLRAE